MFSPEFCETYCPVCVPARKGDATAQKIQAIEMKVTHGGCPWGRARQAKYGVAPTEPLPESARRGKNPA